MCKYGYRLCFGDNGWILDDCSADYPSAEQIAKENEEVLKDYVRYILNGDGALSGLTLTEAYRDEWRYYFEFGAYGKGGSWKSVRLNMLFLSETLNMCFGDIETDNWRFEYKEKIEEGPLMFDPYPTNGF